MIRVKRRNMKKNPIPLYWGNKFKQLLNDEKNTDEDVIIKFLNFIDDEEKAISREFQID